MLPIDVRKLEALPRFRRLRAINRGSPIGRASPDGGRSVSGGWADRGHPVASSPRAPEADQRARIGLSRAWQPCIEGASSLGSTDH